MAVIKIVPFPGPKGDKGDPGSGSQEVIPLPSFLDWVTGRDHLPTLNTNFGWNSDGLWFGPTSDGEGSGTSYPVFTDFTIGQNDAVTVEFNFEVNEECNDVGLCVYVDGDTPDWQWGTDSSRIAAQFDCEMPILVGLTEDYQGERSNISGPGTYHVRFTYNPIGGTPVQFEYFEGTTTETLVSSLTLNETLGTGRYRVGFAADNSNSRTYISDLSIMVNEDTPYVDTLQEGDSGTDQDFVAPMSILDSSSNPLITFEKSYTGTARIVAPQDDLALRSARDILLYAGEDGPGNVYIGWGDADMTPESNNRVATIGDLQDATTGEITFDGVQIIGAGTASGDGNEYGTIELVPDATRYETDQYLVIDPTAPNHIHIHAGGTIDEASADLILGGERNNVIVSDGGRVVGVSTRPDQIINSYSNESVMSGTDFVTSSESDIQIGYTVNVGGTDYVVDTTTTIDEGVVAITASGAVFEAETSYTFTFEPDYNNQWIFAPDGALYGPAMGSLRVLSIMNSGTENVGMYANDADIFLEANAGTVSITATDINIGSNSSPSTLSINTYSGAVINSNRTSGYDPEEKIVATLGDIPTAPTDTAFTVAGGALETSPTFSSDPLFTGSYVKHGDSVLFRINVEMTNITNFGTGQYYVDLPFPSKYGILMRDGCLHDESTGNQWAISGHVAAGQSRLTLWYTNGTGQDEIFDHNSPVTLNVLDTFHVSGSYIASAVG